MIEGLLPPGQALPDRQPVYVVSWIYIFGVLNLSSLVGDLKDSRPDPERAGAAVVGRGEALEGRDARYRCHGSKVLAVGSAGRHAPGSQDG